MISSDHCAAHGCTGRPYQTTRFCRAHLRPSMQICRQVWAAITAAREPGEDYAHITVRELAKRTGHHAEVTFRAVRTLEELGYVRRGGRGVLAIHVGYAEVRP